MNDIQVPNKWSLANFTGLPSFDGTEDGKTEKEVLTKAEEEYNKHLKHCKIGKWVCLIFGVILLFGGSIWWLGIILLILAYGFSKNGFITNQFTKQYDVSVQRYQNYLKKLINFTAQKFFGNDYRWASFNNKYMIYNPKGMVFINTSEDLIVAYKKSDIKEIIRDRIHTGSHSHTSGTTVGGGTAASHLVSGILGGNHVNTTGVGIAKESSDTDTTDFYEWHFDVMTDFMGYPKVSLILPDNRNNENIINEMYAVLKP